MLEQDDAHRADFESLLNAFASLPARSDTSEDAIAIRYRDKEVHKRRLVRLLERSPEIQQHIAATIARVNGTAGDPRSFDALDALLEAQAYRLSYWRVAASEGIPHAAETLDGVEAVLAGARATSSVEHASRGTVGERWWALSVVPLVRKTASGGPQARSTRRKARVGTAGTSSQRITVSGVTPRRSQKWR